jgi:hypothetical protein
MKHYELLVNVNNQQQFLDINDSIGISLNFSISDINDISTKNSSYSKTITLPDTSKNRKIFGYIFGLNTKSNTFNPQRKTKCWVLKDTLTQMEGNIQLVSITYNRDTNLNEYNCVIYADNDNLFKNIGEQYLSDLNLTRFDHNWTLANITNSWNSDFRNGYYYPLIDYGFPLSMTQNLKLENFFPSVYLKTYIDQIFTEAGYTYKSDFLNSEFFTNLIIPFNNKNLESTLVDLELDESNNIFDVALTSDITSAWFRAGGSYGNYDFNNQDASVWCPIVCDYEIFNPNGNYNTTTGVYTNPPDFAFSQKLKIKVDIRTEALNGNSQAIQWGDDFTTFVAADQNGSTIRTESWQDDVYIFVFRSKSVDGSGNYNGGTFGPNMPVGTWYLYNKDWQIWPGTTFLANTITFNGKRAYSVRNGNLTMTESAGSYRYKGEIETDWINDQPMRVGEKLIVYIARKVRAVDNNVTKYKSVFLEANGTAPIDPWAAGFRLQLEASTTQAVGNSLLEAKRFCPQNVKQKDLLANIIKMFNLYIEPDKEIRNNFIIEPRDDYYNNYERQKDWSDKLDISKEVVSRVASDTQARTNIFTYKADKDGMNTNYTNATAQIFGEYKFDIDNDFLSKDKKVEVFFSPTPMNILAGSNNIFIPTISGSNTSVTKSNGMNIRLLYRKKTTTTGSDFIQVNGTSYAYYPYAGFTDNPLSPNLSLNFGQVQLIKDGNYVGGVTPNTIFFKYWQNTITELSNPDIKIVTAFFNLNSSDIENFRFYDLIFFTLNGQDGYYRVNKIYDYDPSAELSTKVELIKTLEYKINGNPIYQNQSGFITPIEDLLQFTNIFTDNSVVTGAFNTSAFNVVKAGNSIVAGNNNYVVSEANLVIGQYNSVSDNNNILSGEGLRALGSNNMVIGSGSSVIGESNIVIGNQNSIISNSVDTNLVVGNRIGGLVEGSFLMGQDISIPTPSQNSFIMGASISGGSEKSFIFGENISLNGNTQSLGATLSSMFLFGNNITIQNPSTISSVDSIFVIGNNVSLTQSLSPNTLYIETENIVSNVVGTSSFNKMAIKDLLIQDDTGSNPKFKFDQSPNLSPLGSNLEFINVNPGLQMLYTDYDGGAFQLTYNDTTFNTSVDIAPQTIVLSNQNTSSGDAINFQLGNANGLIVYDHLKTFAINERNIFASGGKVLLVNSATSGYPTNYQDGLIEFKIKLENTTDNTYYYTKRIAAFEGNNLGTLDTIYEWNTMALTPSVSIGTHSGNLLQINIYNPFTSSNVYSWMTYNLFQGL